MDSRDHDLAVQCQAETEAPSFLIYSPKHTGKRDRFITFWRPNRAGYAWPLSWAGQYTATEAADIAHEEAIPVPAALAFALSVETPRWVIDGDAGPVVPNSRANRRLLSSAKQVAVKVPGTNKDSFK